jgi:hypothetical protein
MSVLVYSVPMPDTFKPWERHPALTAERLSKIVTALREARDDALNTYEPLKGETGWTLGCSQYDRSRFCFREMVRSNPTWLSIVPEKSGLRCTFAIEGVPVRFYHQTADDPPEKYTSSTDGEERQFQMLLEVDGVPFVQTLFRLAIKNYATGKVESITLVEFDDSGAIINEYPIPFDVASSGVIPLRAKGVNLGPVTLEPLESDRPDQKVGNDENDNSSTGTK